MKTYQLFVVPVGNSKIIGNIVFHTVAPVLEYHQKLYNSCCLSSSSSTFRSDGDNRAITSLANHIELSHSGTELTVIYRLH